MRIKTSEVLRYIDRLKASIEKRNLRFQSGLYWIASFSVSSAISSKKYWAFPLMLFVVPLAAQFGGLQFGFFVLLGVSMIRLSVYRLANSFLRLIRI